ncbi:MAG: fructosamine kinase family protein, partial [Armatimonadetes bacterium]|nr:fructosamine kinase family protein [Armatimonadota bacterium]
ISKADVSRIDIAYGACRYLFDKVSEPRLTHNDIWEPNVLVRKNDKWHIVALLDADRAMFADREFESALWWNTESAFWDGYGTRIDPSPEAELRRKFYELYVNLWQAFAFRVQISHPDWCDSFRRKALKILEELSA